MDITFSEKENPDLYNALEKGDALILNHKTFKEGSLKTYSMYQISEVQKFRSSSGMKTTLELKKI